MSNSNPTIADNTDFARRTFITKFESLKDAVAFEDGCLSAGQEFLPECVTAQDAAATPAYWEWLISQAEAVAEEQAAAVEASYAAASGAWTGRSWDDGDKVTPNSTDEQIRSMLANGDRIDVTCWGIVDGSRWHGRVSRSLADLQLSWELEAPDFSERCERLRQLAAESDAGVAEQARLAEDAALNAMLAARTGDRSTALLLAEEAAKVERQYGDAPTWGPFLDAMRTWSEAGARIGA